MPPDMRSPAAELLAAVSEVFDRLHVRWYLFGAQAAIAYGAPRLTADADVTVALGGLSVETLVSELEASGFRLRIRNVGEFAERTHVLPFLHTASTLPVDVVLAGPGPEELFLSRTRAVRFGDVAIPVIAPEDLVAVKILAGRPQDLQDVAGVLRARGDAIDLELVRQTLALFEGALDRRDLTPELERILARVRR
jgi:hypothetical protein